jgi:hypothetical protein
MGHRYMLYSSMLGLAILCCCLRSTDILSHLLAIAAFAHWYRRLESEGALYSRTEEQVGLKSRNSMARRMHRFIVLKAYC